MSIFRDCAFSPSLSGRSEKAAPSPAPNTEGRSGQAKRSSASGTIAADRKPRESKLSPCTGGAKLGTSLQRVYTDRRGNGVAVILSRCNLRANRSASTRNSTQKIRAMPDPQPADDKVIGQAADPQNKPRNDAAHRQHKGGQCDIGPNELIHGKQAEPGCQQNEDKLLCVKATHHGAVNVTSFGSVRRDRGPEFEQ
jgi:hypothetical protein